MEGEYVPPSMRKKRQEVIYVPSVIVNREEENLTEINDEEYVPPSVRKEEVKDVELDMERDFPVLGGSSNIKQDNIWTNSNNLNKIKTELFGTIIKEERVIEVRPEKKLKAVYYDEELEEEQEKKVELSRLNRDMELGIVKYLEEDRVYMYDEKDERSKMAFYEPDKFDRILEDEMLYEEEYYDGDEEDYRDDFGKL
jgi:hypothetical protein